MSAKLFISQEAIDAWVASDRADLAGDVLTLHSGAGALRLAPASLFQRVAAGSDTHGLLGKVKSEDAVAALGGESYLTSVIVGETAYEVEPGFLASPADPAAARRLVEAVRALGS